jgi:hypothetical protein
MTEYLTMNDLFRENKWCELRGIPLFGSMSESAVIGPERMLCEPDYNLDGSRGCTRPYMHTRPYMQ